MRRNIGVSGPWTLATIFGAILGFFILLRFKRGGWKAINIEHHSPAADDSAKLPAQSLATD